jgi:LacI family transcriptional regulator
MGRATIPDIARKAGVSTATVDRALNARPGVSPANRQRVLRAAKELGYLPSEGMSLLPARPAHLEFLIPFGHNAFMRDVTEGITEFAATLPLVATCKVTELDGIGPGALIPALEALSLRTEGVGLITTDHPTSREAIRRLTDSRSRTRPWPRRRSAQEQSHPSRAARPDRAPWLARARAWKARAG